MKRKDAERRGRSATYWSEPWIPVVGQEIPVQPAGREALCRVRILGAQGHRLGDTAYKDARAMGHKTTQEFREMWLRHHDKAWVTRESDADGILDAEQVDARFADRWAHEVVWLVTLELVADLPRFLAAGKGTMDSEGNCDYTHSPSLSLDREAGEAVDAATTARYSKDADAFCVGRQLARQKEAQAQREAKRRVTHPAPWWNAA